MVAGEDVTDVVFEVPKSATVRGEVVLRGKGAPAPAVIGRVEIRLEPADRDALTRHTGPYIVRSDVSGRFEFPAVAPGAYHLSAGLREQPPTWFLDSVTLHGRDLLNDPLEVKPGQTVTSAIATLTQHRGSLAGTLRTETGDSVPSTSILVYPVDERYRGLNRRDLRLAFTSPDGDYVAAGLRPGEYRVVTLDGVKFGAWFDPEFLRQVDPTAVQVSIAANEQKILNLRMPDR